MAPKNWGDHDPVVLFNCGKGFFIFIFESNKVMDLIFKSHPYFTGSKGMFLSH